MQSRAEQRAALIRGILQLRLTPGYTTDGLRGEPGADTGAETPAWGVMPVPCTTANHRNESGHGRGSIRSDEL